MNKAEELIACLEGEIAKRDARIVELELTVFQLNNSVTSHHWENTALRAELSAIKAQEPAIARFEKHAMKARECLPECAVVLLSSIRRLIAAPAAPAADAVLVEALGYQVLFDAIAAATSVYANGAINISVQAFRDALATHRAKGVV